MIPCEVDAILLGFNESGEAHAFNAKFVSFGEVLKAASVVDVVLVVPELPVVPAYGVINRNARGTPDLYVNWDMTELDMTNLIKDANPKMIAPIAIFKSC